MTKPMDPRVQSFGGGGAVGTRKGLGSSWVAEGREEESHSQSQQRRMRSCSSNFVVKPE